MVMRIGKLDPFLLLCNLELLTFFLNYIKNWFYKNKPNL